MADTFVQVTQGTGTKMSADNVGGVNYPIVKVGVGVSGSAVDVSATNPMPVIQTGTPALPTGASTAALQTTGNTSLASIDTKLNSPIATTVANFPVTQPVSAAALPLPAGASTAALQTAGNASLASIDTKLTNPLPVSAATLPLPSGAATAAKQDTGNVSLASIDSKLTDTANGLKVDGSGVTQPVSISGLVPVSGTVAVSNFPATQPVSGTVTANAGTGTMLVDGSAHTQPVSGTVTANAGTGTMLVDGSAHTQPVSGTVAVSNFPATQPVSGTVAATQGTSPWVENVSQFGGSNVVTGVGASGAGIPRVTVSSDSNITNISGTITLPTGASTATKQSDGSQKSQVVDGANATVGPVQGLSGTNYLPVVLASSATPGSAIPARAVLVAGSDGTNARSISTDTSGNVNVNVTSSTATSHTLSNLARNVYPSVNVTTSAYVQLVASTAAAITQMYIFDSSGQTLLLATGGVGSEVDQYYIVPGGNGLVNLSIPISTRISIKAVSATANVGEINITFLR